VRVPAPGQALDEQRKANRAKTLDVPVWAPFKKTDPEWQAALWLYAATEQLRDGMTHRRAEVTASGELRVPDEDPQSTTVHTLTPDEQFAFCGAAQRLIEAILAGSITPRAHEDLAFQLGLLQRFSGLAPAPGATEMSLPPDRCPRASSRPSCGCITGSR
jgi:hypothetical protein